MEDNEEIQKKDDKPEQAAQNSDGTEQAEQPEQLDTVKDEPEEGQSSEPESGTQPDGEGEQGEPPMPEQPETPEPQADVDGGTAGGKMLSQDEVNKIVQRRVAESYNRGMEDGKKAALDELNSKYGLGESDSLDDLLGNGQRYGILDEEYQASSKDLANVRAENALLRSGIDQNRFDDAKAWLAYNHQDVTPITIENALQTHPEWKSVTANTVAPAPMPTGAPMTQGQGMTGETPSIIKKLGGDPSQSNDDDQESERARAFKAMGL